jgi:rhodanese-related sulfurtransferase
MVNKKDRMIIALLIAAVVLLVGCASTPTAEKVTPLEVNMRLPAAYDEGLILLDVRMPEEWIDDCHIEGAMLLPLDSLAFKAAEMLPDKDAEIITYCRTGNRSAEAAAYLVENGYTNISDMGGINDWKALGYPVQCGP